jgi:hypothetical protein
MSCGYLIISMIREEERGMVEGRALRTRDEVLKGLLGRKGCEQSESVRNPADHEILYRTAGDGDVY